MTHRVILRMEIRPELAAEFERTWLEVARTIARRPANQGQTLVRDIVEPHVYHVLTDWASEAEFRAFELSEEHVENRRRLAPFRTGGDMTVSRVVHHLEPVAVAT
ncbi:antibiotic biosynthesis monooxygenase family protein [Streptomyces sp. NPDC056190]|uniref:antibiotic biosynthesis monooxygenase family protein n=1 Tax=Streptomyces sp. NPDC056190 TaxID=3345741 RepID=UPI0035E222CB